MSTISISIPDTMRSFVEQEINEIDAILSDGKN
jgi:hypothetical protein